MILSPVFKEIMFIEPIDWAQSLPMKLRLSDQIILAMILIINLPIRI